MDRGRQPSVPRRALGLIVLAIVLVLQGIVAVAGGASLVAAPDGSIMGMPVAWLDGSPFRDYLIPGLFLLVVLGLAPLVIAYGLLKRQRWAWPAAVLVGGALLVWLTVQYTIVGFAWLQAVYAVVGLVILLLALLPGVRRAAGW